MSDTDRSLSVEFLRDFGTRWDAAWNSHRTEDVLALLHPDIVWDDTVFWPRVIEGKTDMPRYIDAIWTVMPDVRFTEVQFFTAPEEGRALYLFRQTGSALCDSAKVASKPMDVTSFWVSARAAVSLPGAV